MITEKRFETLTVARLGDWYGGMKPIRYPIQAIDAIRDAIVNMAWQVFQPTGADLDVSTAAGFFGSLASAASSVSDQVFVSLGGYPFKGYLSDDYLSTGDKQSESFFQKLGVNATAWASRSARTQAVTSATSSVVICQQMLVDRLQNDNSEYKAVVKQLNAQFSLSKEKAWKGLIWPFGKFRSGDFSSL